MAIHSTYTHNTITYKKNTRNNVNQKLNDYTVERKPKVIHNITHSALSEGDYQDTISNH